MRVFHLLEAMGGGTKKHVQLLVLGLQSCEVEVTLGLPYQRPFEARNALMDYDFPDFMRLKGIRVEQFHLLHGKISLLQDWVALRELFVFLRRERFDVVHTHSAKAGVLGRVAARIAGVPVVIHTPYSLPFRSEIEQKARYWLYYFIEWLLGRVTNVMVATSQAERQEISESGIIASKNIALIHNCFDLDAYEWAFDEREVSKRILGWYTQQLVVGTVARISPQKDIRTLVEAARLVCDRIPQVRFVIVGEGELREEIEQRANDLQLGEHWIMVGKRDDYMRYLRAFDVFAFPSLWEGLPYAPIESMALGTPIVATAAPGTVDLVIHEKTGLLVPVRDAQAMAQSIVRLLVTPDLARKLAQEGRWFVESNFNIERPVAETLAVYQRAVDNNVPNS